MAKQLLTEKDALKFFKQNVVVYARHGRKKLSLFIRESGFEDMLGVWFLVNIGDDSEIFQHLSDAIDYFNEN